MWYWIVMALLIAVALGLIAAIFITLKKNRQTDDDYEDDYEDGYDYSDSDDYDEEDYPSPRSRKQPVRPRREAEYRNPEPVRAREEARAGRTAKRQWKLILENLDTWQKYEYIFYDNIGIGRSRNSSEFEKFLTVQDDPRVSKVHCAIIRKEDKLYVKDVGSRNGTFLNGKRIHQPVMIQKDDVLGVGETQIEIKKVLRERD